MNRVDHARRIDLDALQARFALRVTARLSEESRALPHDLSERLRVGREEAVSRARQARLVEPVLAPSLQGAAQGRLALGGPPSRWLRLASFAPLAMLLLGLLYIEHLHHQAEIRAAAEVDAALLADDLPPEAYRDPGFVAFLKLPEQ